MSVNAQSKRSAPRHRTIYLVRHAIAAERGEKYPDDSVRPLTREGVDKMRKAARGLAELDPGIELVLTSPLVRARRTAEILVAALSPSPALGVMEELAPGRSAAEIAAALRQYTSRHTIALVGHEPDLGDFAGWLIAAREPLRFRKGGIACIEVQTFPPGRNGRLVWFALPKMLRGLG